MKDLEFIDEKSENNISSKTILNIKLQKRKDIISFCLPEEIMPLF